MGQGIKRARALAVVLAALICAGCMTLPSPGPGTSRPPTRTPAAQMPEGEPKAVYVPQANEFISLRVEPEFGSELGARISLGTRMVCLGFEGMFMYVEVEKTKERGYVHGGYVKRVDEDAAFRTLTIVPSDGEHYTYERLREDIAALAVAYPGLFTSRVLAQTADGREIVLCILGDEEAKHKVLVTGAIHAREHMTAQLVAKQMEKHLYAAKHGLPEADGDVAFYVIPMLNPDGVTLSQKGVEGINSAALRTKVAEILQDEGVDAALWKSNARGVDLNRNFPANWDNLGGLVPGSMRYRGSAPFCEAETKAVRDLVSKVRFDATLSYHSTGSYQYWKFRQREDVLARTQALAQAVYAATGYPLLSDGEEADVEGGGLKDWALETHGIPSLTVEVGCLPAPLPSHEWDAIWQRNSGVFATLVTFVKGAAQPR
jgi:g-D-glutamyl-meso-diaminopimelate peptidase